MLPKWTAVVFGLFFAVIPTGIPAGANLSEGSKYEIRSLEAPFVIDLVEKLEPR